MSTQAIEAELQALGNAERAAHSQRFFKTGKGEYAEGDMFLGIPVPELRKQAKRHRDLPLGTLEALLTSPYHEIRLFSLLTMVLQYTRGDDIRKTRIFDSYIQHTEYINHWDLVDTTCPHIVGAHLYDKDRRLLYEFARSSHLWEKRIAVISTFYMIKRGDVEDSLALCEILKFDEHDLIHKAVGWTLREIGKQDRAAEEAFLAPCYRKLPRTLLRYAIEKFPDTQRQRYLNGRV